MAYNLIGCHLPRRNRRGLSVASRSKRGTHPIGTSHATGFHTGFACHPAPTSECGDWHSSSERRAPTENILASVFSGVGVRFYSEPFLRRIMVRVGEAKRLRSVDCGTERTRFPPALFISRFRPVGTLVTHGKGGIPSLYQDGIKFRLTSSPP